MYVSLTDSTAISTVYTHTHTHQPHRAQEKDMVVVYTLVEQIEERGVSKMGVVVVTVAADQNKIVESSLEVQG